ncbi:MAG: Hsp70 family protein, partial [Perlabentimonas sp.]
MGRIIAIDFGTANSSMAILKNNELLVIPNSEGELATPSVVSFSMDGNLLVGKSAKRQAVINPERTIFSVKRKIGTNYIYTIDDKKYTPTEITSLLLKKLKYDAEHFL